MAVSRWYSEGQKVNPAANDLLADTGAFKPSVNKTFKVLVSSSAAASIQLQHRDSANTTTLRSQLIHVVALTPLTIDPMVNGITLGENERFRVVVDTTLVGTIQASIFHD